MTSYALRKLALKEVLRGMQGGLGGMLHKAVGL
jgi:hypothetical protein